jgi:hypothetical protein
MTRVAWMCASLLKGFFVLKSLEQAPLRVYHYRSGKRAAVVILVEVMLSDGILSSMHVPETDDVPPPLASAWRLSRESVSRFRGNRNRVPNSCTSAHPHS